MASDPTTKDLIEEGKRGFCKGPGVGCEGRAPLSEWCAACLHAALADRLEEVEEERLAYRLLLDGIRRHLRCGGWTAEGNERSPGVTGSLCRRIVGWINRRLEGGDADDRGPRAHAPDPDVTQGESEDWPASYMLTAAWGLIANAYGGDWSRAFDEWREAAKRWRDEYVKVLSASPEPSDPEPDPGVGDGETYNPQWMPPEDPEPEDDPWEEIESWADRWPVSEVSSESRLAPAVAAALVDLRKRVQRNGLTRERIRSIETMADVVTKNGAKMLDRLEALEQHADRGSKAERELRERLENLERWVREGEPLEGES